MSVPLKEVVEYLDTQLRIAEIPDDPQALNGLQVEAGAQVSRVLCAVDASERAVEEACRQGANLLVVHHGLFWSGHRPVTGLLARKLQRCFAAGVSVYSAHLPLDVHPEYGNNVGLLRALGLVPDGTFGRHQTTEIGLTATCDWSLAELEERLSAAVKSVRVFGAGPERLRRLGVVTGGGGSLIGAAARAGLDAFITGEAAHHCALEAEERHLHLILAGHYRSETFGVKALGRLLEVTFGLPSAFVELDTGL